MRLLIFLLSALVGICNSARVVEIPTAETCKIGQEWVVTFIKFKCYQMNTRGITKGVRGTGCVPSNDLQGQVILNGSTWSDSHFTYMCNKTRHRQGSKFSFKPVYCLDSAKKILQPGESRVMPDGQKYKCFFDDEMDVHLAIDGSDIGCNEGTVHYKERSAWMYTKKTVVETAPGVKTDLGIGIARTCDKNSLGQYVKREYGCITVDNNRVDTGKYGLVGGKHVVQCVQGKDGLELVLVNENLVSCKVDGKRVPAGTVWDSKDGKERLRCDYGKVVKTGCLVSGPTFKNKFVRINEFEYIEGIGYQCGEEINKGIVNFGTLKGCKLENGTTVEFFREWTTDNQVLLCRYRIDNGVASAFVQQTYCRWNEEKVQLAETVAIGKEVVVCELKGREYIVRKLDDLEMKEWKAHHELAALVAVEFQATHGEGQGHYIKEKKTSPAPKPTPAAVKSCSDYLPKDFCKSLSPICANGKEKPLDKLKSFLGTLKKEEKEKLEIILREFEVDSSATTQPLSILLKTAFTSGTCRRCSSQRESIEGIVQSLCPQTCNYCGKAEDLQQIGKALLELHAERCPQKL